MNAKRRTELKRITKDIKSLIDRLVEIRLQEEKAFDNTPESLREAREDDFSHYSEQLENAMESLNEAEETLQYIITP